jgi:hypothetical protein
MNVGDLRQHLADLAQLLESAGGKSAAKDLAALSEALAPFAGQSPTEFTRFLALAHEYHSTGKLSAPPKPPRAPRATNAKGDPSAVAVAVRALYDRAGDASLPMDQIESGLAGVSGLSKDGLLNVCQAMELAGMKSRKVDEIRGAIRQKVLDRRAAAQRATMIEGGPA